MTREQKLALIVGFALVLVVGVLVSDHLSLAQKQVAGDEAGLADALEPEREAPGLGRDLSGLAIASPPREQATPLDENYFTGEPGPRMADSGGSSLEQRARQALDLLADGAEQVGTLIRDGQNHNLPAAQTEFVTPSIRGTEPTQTEQVRLPERSPERSPAPSKAAKANYPVHIVKSGESLWSIAEHYYSDGTLYTKLAAFNADRTGPEGTIRVGATLLVPPRGVLTGEKVATTPNRRTEPARGGGSSATEGRKAPATTYTVKSGDTLSEISQTMLGTSKRWREILDLNKNVLEDAESLRVGMTLKIPAR